MGRRPKRVVAGQIERGVAVYNAYTYVDGDTLTGLILEIREQFWMRPPHEHDDFRRPSSVRQVAIDVFERRSTEARLSVVRDLIVANGGFALGDRVEHLFETADTPADYLTDLVCAVVQDVLRRDPDVAAESERREAMAAESLSALREDWRRSE
jgi:hypothetical protein